MSLNFGPQHLGVTPRSSGDVRVLNASDDSPAALNDPVVLSPLGDVSFSVLDAGRYKVVATDGILTVTKTVELSDILGYDITDARSYADNAPSVGAGSDYSGGGGSPITSEQITDATGVGRAVLTATNAASARNAVGAGTSNLQVGTTSSSAKAGDWVPGLSDIPTGSVLFVTKDETTATWPARPTTRTDVRVIWSGTAPAPTPVSSGTGGAYENDKIEITAS